jgi:hypothetical protein
VSDCKYITDESLKALAAGSPRLEELNVSECVITDRGIATLHLNALDLLCCTSLTDDTLST